MQHLLHTLPFGGVEQVGEAEPGEVPRGPAEDAGRGAGGEAVRQCDQAHERRAPDHDLLGETRQMHRRDRRRRKSLKREIPVGHGIDRICHWRIKAQPFRSFTPVNGEGGSCKRHGPQWGLVQSLARVPETAAVALCHLHVSEKMMAECDGLGRLEMSEAGHERVRVFQCPVCKGALI